MRLKQKTRYAIRVLLCLAQNPVGLKVGALAQQTAIPQAQFTDVMNGLKEAQLVESVNGRKGGCRLSKAPLLISLYDVMTAVDELFRLDVAADQAAQAGEGRDERALLAVMQRELALALRGVNLDYFCDTAPYHCQTPQALSEIKSLIDEDDSS